MILIGALMFIALLITAFIKFNSHYVPMTLGGTGLLISFTMICSDQIFLFVCCLLGGLAVLGKGVEIQKRNQDKASHC